MSNEDQHPLDAAIEKFKRRRTWRGKRKGYMGRGRHAKGLKWLEKNYDSLEEEEKERLRNLFDQLPKGDVD